MAKHNPVDSAGNVRVDFVWGNMPMQPDDARGAAALDPAVDNHYIATAGWNNFPGYAPNVIGDGDPYLNIIVPNVVGLNKELAKTQLEAVGLSVTVASGAVGGSASISKVKVDKNTAIITTPSANGFLVSALVTITGCSDAIFNVTDKAITKIDTNKNTFEFALTNPNVAEKSATGTATILARHSTVKQQSIAPFDTVYGSDVDYGDAITITPYN